MEIRFKDFLISDDKEKIQLDTVCRLLSSTYWAKDRPKDTIEKSIANSMVFGVYLDDKQVGFARCITDFSVFYWLADVVIDEDYRKMGLGKALVEAILTHEALKGCLGALKTEDAHRLYNQYGFKLMTDIFMQKLPNQP